MLRSLYLVVNEEKNHPYTQCKRDIIKINIGVNKTHQLGVYLSFVPIIKETTKIVKLYTESHKIRNNNGNGITNLGK